MCLIKLETEGFDSIFIGLRNFLNYLDPFSVPDWSKHLR